MADTDISTTFADRFAVGISDQGQPVNDMVTARLQRIQELERIRQEHIAAHPVGGGDSETRHSRRDRFIRQTTQRSTERRSFASNIQRTPVRSQSYENTNLICVNEDTLNFRDFFESTRQTLFGPRPSSSNENLDTTTALIRRPSDTTINIPRPLQAADTEYGSGSSTPITGVRPQFDIGSGSSTPRTAQPRFDITAGLAEAFSNVRTSILGSDVSITPRDNRRSASITRETRNSATNIQRLALSNGSPLTRSASLREPRRESRFRRRTIQGVDSNITQALEQERQKTTTSSAARSMSPLVVASIVPSGTSEVTSVMKSSEITHASSYSSFPSSYASRFNKVELYPEDSVPVLGFEKEKVVFVDDTGHCHWLDKTHQIVRSVKAKSRMPEIIVKPKLAITSGDDTDGYIATLEGDCDDRYATLRELVKLARKRDANFENGDSVDSALSLLEIQQRGDFVEDINIDEKYKFVSLYSKPRPRPNMDTLFSNKEVASLYEGIPKSELPQEVLVREGYKVEDSDPPPPIHGANKFLNVRNYPGSRYNLTGDRNKTIVKTEHSQITASQDQYSDGETENGDYATHSRSHGIHESYSAEADLGANGHERVGYSRSGVRHEQSQVLTGDGVSSFLQRRAEARRQQYLAERQTTANGSTSSERHAGVQQHQFAEERRTSNDGTTSHRQVEQKLEESTSHTSTDDGRSSTFQRRSAQQHVQTSSTLSGASRNTTTSSSRVEHYSSTRQSAQSWATRQPSVDNSDIHDEVNLVMERLHMMQGGIGMPVDTSHLDYEEMLMIQKALEENPSPPDSPVMFQDPEQPQVVTPDDQETVDSPTEAALIEEAENGGNHHFNPVLGRDEPSSVTNLNHSAGRSSTVSSYSRATDSSKTSDSKTSAFLSAKETAITHSSESSVPALCEENVPEPRTARYQRLPSEGAESRLPLPSMDWSPLERSNSPISPKRFTFENKNDKSSESSARARLSSSSGAAAAAAALSSKTTIPKVGHTVERAPSSRASVQDELTIQIPSESANISSTILGSANQKDCNKSDTEGVELSISPLVESNVSQGSSQTPSPADSETVTTVFEEFVQTIPRSMLSNWPSSP